jgi:hypothetical protein
VFARSTPRRAIVFNRINLNTTFSELEVPAMSDDDSSSAAPRPSRVINATRSRGGSLLGDIEIHATTKHGSTAMISVMPPTTLSAGETLVTDAWVFGARNLVVVAPHAKPMKLPGVWYEVRIVKQSK